MVPPSSHRIPRVRWYSGSNCVSSRFAYKTVTSSGRPSHAVPLRYLNRVRCPKPLHHCWFRISFDFSSSGYLDVSVPRVPLVQLCIHCTILTSSIRWFPNSEICGSKPMSGSPQLIAGCHVLRRLPMPRHPPCALFSLNSTTEISFRPVLSFGFYP